ncbi:MarR family winged helix-turn-helix transcriptional regulator [Kineosporia babensis]|uniref:MarR family winged helix-turn-helix transcriptional regulator n=1 Tax=Kineosporia babensis TaxID=499548 RepID=A0A9X1SY24_9ACTN|nr:MarR family winged helix-turn-helix transcriptional regulator [Kineosporia babensis]MCD5315865.1 MarR family winged helix-turn-helix transcriptional regulator [Kineosporia babensis]
MLSEQRTPGVPGRGHLVDAVLAQVRPLVLNSARAVEALWGPAGVSVGMRAVLQILQHEGPLPVPAIAERLDLARQGVQRHVNDLAALNLVDSRANPGHRRSVLIHTTAQGEELFARLRQSELEHLARTVPECPDEDLNTTLQVLRRLNRDVRANVQHLREET